MVKRREFIGHLVLAGSGVALAGCPTAQDVFNELDTWVPVAIATFDGIVVFVDSVLTVIAPAVDAAWVILRTAIDAYVHTPNPTATLLDKVIAGLDAVETALANIPQLPGGLPSNILSAAKLGLALLIATLKNIQSRINPQPTPAQIEIRAKSSRAAASLPAMLPAKSTQDFVNQINKIMTNNNVALRVK